MAGPRSTVHAWTPSGIMIMPQKRENSGRSPSPAAPPLLAPLVSWKAPPSEEPDWRMSVSPAATGKEGALHLG